MAKILQVRLVEGEYEIVNGKPVLNVSHEIEEQAVVYASHSVAALRYEKFLQQMLRLAESGEPMLEKPNLGGRKPKDA